MLWELLNASHHFVLHVCSSCILQWYVVVVREPSPQNNNFPTRIYIASTFMVAFPLFWRVNCSINSSTLLPGEKNTPLSANTKNSNEGAYFHLQQLRILGVCCLQAKLELRTSRSVEQDVWSNLCRSPTNGQKVKLKNVSPGVPTLELNEK